MYKILTLVILVIAAAMVSSAVSSVYAQGNATANETSKPRPTTAFENYTAGERFPQGIQMAIITMNGTDIRGWIIDPKFEYSDPASMAGCAIGGAAGWVYGGGSLLDEGLWKAIGSECG